MIFFFNVNHIIIIKEQINKLMVFNI